jgi:predicted nucleic acid-binding OB-fold protein
MGEIVIRFNPKALAARANELRSFDDPELGLVEFKLLTGAEMMVLERQGLPQDTLGLKASHMMISKVHPEITEEDLTAMDAKLLAHLLERLVDEAGFRAKKPESGSS